MTAPSTVMVLAGKILVCYLVCFHLPHLVASLLLGVLDFYLCMQKGSLGEIQGTPFELPFFSEIKLKN